MSTKKRIGVKLKHPNPLFEKWLKEWKEEAASKNSKTQFCYDKALKSLCKYPLPLQSGKDCKVLNGFGDKLCAMLDKKIAEYKSEHPHNSNTDNDLFLDNINVELKQRKTQNRKSTNEYVPAPGSGSHAILETLYTKSLETNYPGYLKKADVIKFGQSLSDTSFTKPADGSFYTAWSSIKTLLNKNLVHKEGNPPKFSLTKDGLVLAEKLHKSYTNNQEKFNDTSSQPSTSCNPDEIFLSSQESNKSNSTNESNLEDIIFSPGNFDILLIVDQQETAGKTNYDEMIVELNSLNVPYEVRHLKVGDYTWICKDRNTNKELVLPYIVERKRMDDFASSIKDGRFHEQKFRLKQCGIQNLIYLVESWGRDDIRGGLPILTLQQAHINTLVQDDFSVKLTEGLKHTVEYLSCFTTILKNIYQFKTFMGCVKDSITKSTPEDDIIFLMTFNEFNKGAIKAKNLKVQDLFIRQLLQLNGVSVDKALAITEKYPTPKLLRIAYNDCTEVEGEKLLSNIQFGKLNKKIGPVISSTIYKLYNNKQFL